MFPVIRNGDRVRIAPLDGPVRRGDIVLVVIAGAWVLHRVVETQQNELITQGDNQNETDSPVSLAHAVGRATHARRRLSLPLVWPQPLTRLWVASGPTRRAALRAILR